MKRLISDVVEIEKTYNLTDIEIVLNSMYENIVRWAIVDVDDNCYKISLSYESKEA